MGLKQNKEPGKPSLLRSAEQTVSCRIIGIDPGLASTGWGVIDSSRNKLHYIAHGCIETPSTERRGERLLFIYKSLLKVLKTYKPVKASIENLFFSRNASSAMGVAEARGVLFLGLENQGIPVLELTPNAIKKGVVGVTKADKKQVQEMVRLILGLKEIPKPDHAADALAAAMCTAHSKL